jgi:hypothetical protein
METDGMEATIELLGEAYRHFNVRDIDGVLRLMELDVEWPNGMEGGWVFGQEAVRQYWTRQWLQVDPHVKPVGFRAEDGKTVVLVEQVVRDLKGVILQDRKVEHVYTLDNGLIQRMEIREVEP